MKALSIFSNAILAGLVALSTMSCDPVEDRKELPAPMPKSALKFSVTQKAGYDNIIMMQNQTSGIIPFWDYGTGVSNKQFDTILIPFAGKHIIRFNAYAGGLPTADSVEVMVSQNDPNYFSSPLWNLLTNGIAGKTWVWANDNPGKWITGGGDIKDVQPGWWKDAIDNTALADEMTFNLNGSFNFTLATPAKTENALFKLDTTAKKLEIIGSDVSKGMKKPYDIIKLTEDEMILAVSNPADWGGWRNFFYFKRKGYKF